MSLSYLVSIKVETDDEYTRTKCIDNPNKLYIFGENLEDRRSNFPGAGQACIRTMDNAYGFITKKSASEYLSDDNYDNNSKLFLEQCLYITNLVKYNEKGPNYFTSKYDTVVFPKYGLGTGRAAMQRECPVTFIEMCRQLYLWFKYNNLQNLTSPNY
jgi:hypothetical protein